MDKKVLKQLYADIEAVRQLHPTLIIIEKNKVPFSLKGDFVINDDKGVLQDQFKIEILIPLRYPYGFPTLFERSSKIPRIKDRHINEEGQACVEVIQKARMHAQKGISLLSFIQEYVWKYFCWQILYDAQKEKGELLEWAHSEQGIIQFYGEYFDTADNDMILKLLTAYSTKNLPSRNIACVCGSTRKAKNCHLPQLEALYQIGREQIEIDMYLIKQKK